MKRILFIISIVAVITACKKEPDSPPENVLNTSKLVTVDSLRSWQQSVSPNGVSITDSLHVYGIVTMDESEGNIYKNLYIQDHTAGINMRLTGSSDFAVGDSVRVSLIGGYLSEYSGVIQLDSIDPDVMIVRQSIENVMDPVVKTISEITLADEGLLIKIENVQFSSVELANSYADQLNQSSENRIIEDCCGNTIIVRTSGFADYAGQTVKQGNGDITVIVNRFDDELQLYIRSLPELNFNNTRCTNDIIIKDFDDASVTSGGWTIAQVSGLSVDWSTSTLGGADTPYGVISNFSGSNTACENWLISPPLDLTTPTCPSLQFNNAYNFTGDSLRCMISTDFTGTGNPNSSTWTDLSSMISWSGGGFTWEHSGVIDLSPYAGGPVYIAFKYVGTNSDGSTWELDDIKIVG